MVAAETRGRITGWQAAGTVPWIGVDDSAEEQRLQADHAAKLLETANFQLATQKHTPVPMIRNPRCRKTEAWLVNGARTTVLPFLQDFDNTRVGAERNPLKTEVIHYLNDLDAAPPKWRIGDVRSLAKTFDFQRMQSAGPRQISNGQVSTTCCCHSQRMCQVIF